MAAGLGDSAALASTLSERLERFVAPLLVRLDQVLDRRLVKTFAAPLSILLQQRYRTTGLLLSELGAFLSGAEHALESPRLWFWENRQKLLQIVTLADAFLLSLLQPELQALRDQLLRRFCPRTGMRSREVSTPLYRLRAAISFFFLSLRTPLLPQLQSLG